MQRACEPSPAWRPMLWETADCQASLEISLMFCRSISLCRAKPSATDSLPSFRRRRKSCHPAQARPPTTTPPITATTITGHLPTHLLWRGAFPGSQGFKRRITEAVRCAGALTCLTTPLLDRSRQLIADAARRCQSPPAGNGENPIRGACGELARHITPAHPRRMHALPGLAKFRRS